MKQQEAQQGWRRDFVYSVMSSQTSCLHPCAASLQRRPWQLHRPTRSCTRPWGASQRRTRPAVPARVFESPAASASMAICHSVACLHTHALCHRAGRGLVWRAAQRRVCGAGGERWASV